MTTISIELEEAQIAQLQEKAEELNLPSANAYVRQLVEQALDSENAEFERITDYLLTKNAELYRRLA
jgi:hypothetical protein